MKKLIVFGFLFAMISATHAQITSTFDTDADGWTFYHGPSGTYSTINHSTSGGNPGGYISVTYASQVSTSAVQYWIAPAKYLGTKVAQCLDMNFKLDLQQSVAGTNSSTRGDIRIKNGSDLITFSFPSKPAVAPLWSSYSIPLNETGGWQWGNLGPLATRDQIKHILSNVTGIEINGTYAANASYLSGLDNVVLEERVLSTAPAVSSLSTTSGKPGQTITINGTGFNTTAANNVVRFGAVAGTVTNATATQLIVTIPVGAQYGKIVITNIVTGLASTSPQSFNPVFDGGGRIIRDSFKPRVDITPTTDVEGFTVKDIDGNGWSDVIIASSTAYKTISIYPNLGIGGEITAASFAPVTTVTIPGTGTNTTGAQFADLDGDGKLDLITSNVLVTFGGAYFITYRNISTPGNIAFEAPEFWAGLTDDTPPGLITDLDGDGRPELISGEGSFSTGASFWITQNISTPGNIEFGSAVGYFINASNGGFGGASAGDLDGDGKPEMMVAHGDRYSIFKNNSAPGSISLTSIGMITSGQYISSLQTPDFNLDGKNDLVWKNNGVTIFVRLNTNTGGPLALTDFAAEVTFAGDLNNYGSFSIGDINGDGKPDIAACEDGDLGIYENRFSGGTFDNTAFIPAYSLQGYASGTYPWTPVVADLNGDLKPELIVATTNNAIRISIFENKNVHAPAISVNTVSPLAGAIGSTVTITGNNFSTTLTDNKVKIGGVDATVLTATPTQLTVSVPAGAGYGYVSVTKAGLTSRYRLPFKITFSPGVNFDNTHFAPPVNFTLTNANYDIEAGDLNRDGKPDLLAEANGGFVFRNTHTTGAISATSLVPDDTLSVNSFINPRLEDFDGDGLLDVISVNGLLHKNTSTTTEISHYPSVTVGLGASTLDMSDFNNDGKVDATVTTDLSGAGDLIVLENRSITSSSNFTTGTYGIFSANIVFNKPAANGGVVSEDFDGDGFADIATTNPGSDNISLYRNLGVLKISTAQFATRVDVAVGDTPGRIYKGDFDSD
ncbi:MAG TPA: FG-GAP-like repeat-containing protein, partial [Ohtaekwangia sp.]